MNHRFRPLPSFWEKQGKLLRSYDCDLTKAKDYEGYIKTSPYSTLTPALVDIAIADSTIVDWPPTKTPNHLPIGAVFQDAPFAPEMVMIPAGTFMMGSPKTEVDRNNRETLHKVTLTQPFAMVRYPVTFAEWEFSQTDKDWQQITGKQPYSPYDCDWGRGDRPVISIHDHDALAYAMWLSAKTGQFYDLPTAAQWEYAARAGSSTPFWFGKTITTDQIRPGQARPIIMDTNLIIKQNIERKHFLLTALKPIRLVFIKCMAMCVSGFSAAMENMKEEHGLMTNPKRAKPSSGTLRGGGWNHYPQYLRSANDRVNVDGIRNNNLGFRLMRQPS